MTKIKNPKDTARDEEAFVIGTERRFRLLADAIPLIVWTANPNGELDYYNQQWEIYTGFTAEETQGWGWAPVLHPDDLQRCIDKWTKAFTTGEPYEIEYRFKRAADGAYRWHLGRAIPFRDESGTIIKWFGTGTDIDDQIRAKELINQAYFEIENVVKQRTAELAIANQELVRQNEIKESAVEALLREIDQRILVEHTVSANELRTRKIIESSYDAFVAIDAQGVIIDWNQQAETLFGWKRQEAIGAVLADLVIPERYREAHAAGMKRFIASGASTVLNKRIELVGLRRSREEFPLELTIRALQYNEKDGYEFCAFLRDITERKIAEERLLYFEKARAEITLNSISDAVIGTDMSGNVDYLNVAAEKMTGWSREEACGKPIGEVMQIINGTTGKTERNPVEWVLQQNQPMGLNADSILVRRDGIRMPIEDSAAPIRDVDGKISGAVMVFHDITAAQAMTMKMAHLAQHDFLTNLPNRLLLNDRIAQAIVLAERRTTQVAVLFLDLDNFKHINDSLGHVIGDQLLQSVALRLSACVRSSDTVSRQGGDEFVVLVTEDKYAENASLTADKILTALAMPHIIDQHELHVTTSIGISVYPADGQNAETLIKNADTAMYQAKAKGRNNY